MKIEIKFYGSDQSTAKIGVRWEGNKGWSDIGPNDVEYVDGVPYDFSDLKGFGKGVWTIPDPPKPRLEGMHEIKPDLPNNIEADELIYPGKLRKQDHSILSANHGRTVAVNERPAILIYVPWEATLGAQPFHHVAKVDFRSIGSAEPASPEAQDLVSRMLWEPLR